MNTQLSAKKLSPYTQLDSAAADPSSCTYLLPLTLTVLHNTKETSWRIQDSPELFMHMNQKVDSVIVC